MKICQKILVIILVITFLFHIPGLFYGYPLKNTVGDEVTTMGVIFKMFNDFNPIPNYESFYHFPMAAYFQIPFYVGLVGFLGISGIFTDVESLRTFVVLDHGKLLPFARLISVFYALLSVYILFRIVKKIGGSDKVASLAAFLLSFNLMFFQVTHFARVWALQIALILFAVYWYLDWNEKEDPKPKDYFWVGLSTFLTYGVHVVGGLVYSMFLVLFAFKLKNFKKIGNFKKHFYTFLILQVGLLLGLAAYYFLNSYGFMVYLNQPGIEGADPEKTWNFLYNIKYYGWIFFTYDWLTAVLSVPAFIYFYKKNKEIALGLLSFIFVFVGVISYFIHSEPRFIVSTMPFVIIPVSFFLVYLIDLINSKIFRIGLYVVLVVVILYLPILWTKAIITPHTLVSARAWVIANIPPNTGIVTNDPYIDIPQNKKAVMYDMEQSKIAQTSERRFIASASSETLGQARYFVVSHGSLGPLKNNENCLFKYAIISFWDQGQGSLIRAKLPVGAKVERKWYPSDKVLDLTDIANNMHYPMYILNSIDKTGPYVEIYNICAE